MRLFSKLKPAYLPETDQVSVLRLGLAPLKLADWLQEDADFHDFHAHKTAMLTHFPAHTCLSLPGTEAIQAGFARFLLYNLGIHPAYAINHQQAQLQHVPTGICWATSNSLLAHCGRWIQEDICLLEPVNSCYVLVAASVCSPSNWKLEEKIGKSLDDIHAPVPGYEQHLAKRVNRLLLGLKPGKAFRRFNWSVQRGNELCWRSDMHSAAVSDELFWRVERQSLLKIPDTNTIVFSIRIYLHNIHTLTQIGAAHQHLKALLARLPADQFSYKELADKILQV